MNNHTKHIYCLTLGTLYLLGMGYFDLSFIGTNTDTIISILLGIYAVYVVKSEFREELRQILKVYAGLFISLCLVVLAVFMFNRGVALAILVFSTLGLTGFIVQKFQKNPIKILNFILATFLLFTGIYGMISTTNFGDKISWKKITPPLARECSDNLCITVYRFETGFFFGDNYIAIYKSTILPGLEKKMGIFKGVPETVSMVEIFNKDGVNKVLFHHANGTIETINY